MSEGGPSLMSEHTSHLVVNRRRKYTWLNLLSAEIAPRDQATHAMGNNVYLRHTKQLDRLPELRTDLLYCTRAAQTTIVKEVNIHSVYSEIALQLPEGSDGRCAGLWTITARVPAIEQENRRAASTCRRQRINVHREGKGLRIPAVNRHGQIDSVVGRRHEEGHGKKDPVSIPERPNPQAFNRRAERRFNLDRRQVRRNSESLKPIHLYPDGAASLNAIAIQPQRQGTCAKHREDSK